MERLGWERVGEKGMFHPDLMNEVLRGGSLDS